MLARNTRFSGISPGREVEGQGSESRSLPRAVSIVLLMSIFLRLSDRWALGADNLQWILYKSIWGVPPDLTRQRWKPLCFVHTHKRHLLRYIRENRPQDADAAALALAGYPDTFDAWKATVDALPPPVPRDE
jgi:hypothetical protein